jgi:hypothetical protein
MMDQRLVQLEFFGGECPVQSWGTLLGKPFYFRARWNYWTFEVGEEKYLPACNDSDISHLDYYIEQEYGNSPYDAGYMPFAESREIIISSICAYLQKRGNEDTTILRNEILAWFDQWIEENPDYQKRGPKKA